MNLPELAISVRQPWAWAIIYAGKDIENRSAGMVRHLAPLTGWRAVHAAKGMTREEYEDGRDFMATLGITVPLAADLQRGGIIGTVQVACVVKESTSRWFFGPRGLVLADAKPIPFIPSVGALGYFRWKPADPSIVPAAARWMLPRTLELPPVAEPLPDLFADRRAS